MATTITRITKLTGDQAAINRALGPPIPDLARETLTRLAWPIGTRVHYHRINISGSVIDVSVCGDWLLIRLDTPDQDGFKNVSIHNLDSELALHGESAE